MKTQSHFGEPMKTGMKATSAAESGSVAYVANQLCARSLEVFVLSYLVLLVAWLTCAVHVEASSAWTSGRRVQRMCTFEDTMQSQERPRRSHVQAQCPVRPVPTARKQKFDGTMIHGGERRPCPAGVYGAEEALRRSSAQLHVLKHPVPAPEGFYALGGEPTLRRRSSISPCSPGSFCVAGTSKKCPAGTYGATAKLSTSKCTDLCQLATIAP
ncbi:hypothetical protein GQ600_17568 [Phytophthora cactorum]|nr:hypothetical protein GQ600_17568 [Phytophthora cactorum]